MSKSTTPKYVLEMSGFTSSAWKGRVPSVAKLEHEVMAFVVSTYPGFCNAHIGKHCGIKIPARAAVRVNDHVGRVLSDLANVYWENEQGSDSYIDVEEVVKRGLVAVHDPDSDWHVKAIAEINDLIQAGMSERKYDLGIIL